MKSIISSAAVILTMTLCLGVANASGPIGIYALVDKVAFEPNADKPERIRIAGVFSVAEETPDNSTVYSAPQRGYLYFGLPGLPSGNQDLARREWADLKIRRRYPSSGGIWIQLGREGPRQKTGRGSEGSR